MPLGDETWEDYVHEGSECSVYTFFVSQYYDSDLIKDQENMKKHVLLEFLHDLGVLVYNRGYDGLYYDIHITKRRKR
jgi:hypothetical protein